MKKLFSIKNFMGLFLASALLLAIPGFMPAAAAQSSCGTTYTVQRGDYLVKIARICGVSYSDLLKANPSIINPSRIYPGQVINIPSGTIPVTGSQPGTYTVQAGNTLYSIGQYFNLSVTELREANPAVGSTVSVGQVLQIPARIQFATGGTSAVRESQLSANSQHTYLLWAAAGQTLEVTASPSSGLNLEIRGADGSTLKNAGGAPTFRGVLPRSQDYILVLTSGGSAVDYRLDVDIPLRISFTPGGTSATLTGAAPASLGQYFILRAGKGQTMDVTASPQDQLQLVAYGVDGSVLASNTNAQATLSAVLPATQDYILVLKSTTGQAQAFTLKVSIPASPTIPVTGNKSYTVVKGDTLYSIARRYGTTINALLRANPEITSPTRISVGQVIYLPGATLTLSNGQVVYITDRGDTMSIIAREFGVTLSALIAANPQISNPSLIYIGERINIP